MKTLLSFLCFLQFVFPAVAAMNHLQFQAHLSTQVHRADGDLSEWINREAIDFSSDENLQILVTTAYLEDAADLSAKLWLAYDQEYFHLACEVKDTLHNNPWSGQDIWQGDSIQIAFDPLLDAKAGEGYNKEDIEIGMALLNDGSNSYVYYKSPLQRQQAYQYAIKRHEQQQSTIYELSIAWRELAPFDLGTCPMFGFSLVVFDNDGRGVEKALELTPGILYSKRPASFARIVLFSKNFTATDSVYFQPIDQSLCFFSSQKPLFSLPYFYLNNTGKVEDKLQFEVQQHGKTLCSRQETIKLLPGLNHLSLEYVAEPIPVPGDLQLVFKSDNNIVSERNMQFYSDASAQEQFKLLADYQQRLTDLLAETNSPCPYLQSKQMLLQDFLDFMQTELNRQKMIQEYKISPMSNSARLQTLQRVEINIQYLLNMAEKTLKKLPQVQQKWRPPVIDPADIRIHQGNFYAGEKTVIMTGGCTGFGEFRFFKHDRMATMPEFIEASLQRLSIDRRYGFNVSDYGRSTAQQAADFIRAARAQGFASSIIGVLALNLDKIGKACQFPALVQQQAQHVTKNLPVFASEPGLLSHKIAGEIQQSAAYCQCDICQEKFQEYLQNQYRNVSTMNQLWGSNYPDFQAVAIPDLAKCQFRPLLLEYNRHIQRLTVDFYKNIRSLFKAESRLPVQSYQQLWRRLLPHGRKVMLDFEALVDEVFNEIIGFDGVILPESQQYAYNWNVAGEIMCYDYYKSLRADCPLWQGEFHIFNDGRMPEESLYDYVYAVLWQSVLHGVRANQIWQWSRGDFARVVSNNLYSRADALDAAATASLDLRRLASHITAFNQNAGPLAIFWPAPMLDDDYAYSLKEAYEGSFFLGFPVRFITERRLAQLDRYQLLLVPEIKHLPDSQLQRIHAWVKKGGCLILLGEETFTADEWGVNRDLNGFSADSGAGVIVNIPAKKIHRKQIFQQLQTLLNERKIVRDVEVVNVEQDLPWAVESREIDHGSDKIIYILNLHTETQELCLRSQAKKITAVHELIYDQEMTVSFTLPPRKLLLLKVSRTHGQQ